MGQVERSTTGAARARTDGAGNQAQAEKLLDEGAVMTAFVAGVAVGIVLIVLWAVEPEMRKH